MTRIFLLATAIGVLAAGADAQTSTTDCTESPGALHCQTVGPSPPINFVTSIPDTSDSFFRGYEQGRAMAAQRAADRAARAGAADSSRDEAWRKRLGAMAAQGYCAEARAAALTASRLEDAAWLASICQPR